MPRFFLQHIDGQTAYIEGDDARHIAKSLHAKPGRELVLCDMKGTDFLCKVREIDSSLVILDILSSEPSRGEPRTYIKLYQALPKGEKFEFIVQKAVELGVSEIIPVLTSRCVSRPSYKAMEKKLVRFGRIAHEAAKQCGRGIVPPVRPLLEFQAAAAEMAGCDLPILFYEESGAPLRSLLQASPGCISIMIGSEGGFSQSEVQLAAGLGVHTAGLGKRILRCETAPIVALSAILYQLGEF